MLYIVYKHNHTIQAYIYKIMSAVNCLVGFLYSFLISVLYFSFLILRFCDFEILTLSLSNAMFHLIKQRYGKNMVENIGG